MLQEKEGMVKIQIIRIDDNSLDWKYNTDEKVYYNVPIFKEKNGRKYFKTYGKKYLDNFIEC